MTTVYVEDSAPNAHNEDTMRLPSVKTLCELKDVTPEIARQMRAVMAGPKKVDGLTRMQRLDALYGSCGVEYIPCGKGACSPAFYYCNAGDTYAPTIVKFAGTNTFRVTTWGDIVERGNYE